MTNIASQLSPILLYIFKGNRYRQFVFTFLSHVANGLLLYGSKCTIKVFISISERPGPVRQLYVIGQHYMNHTIYIVGIVPVEINPIGIVWVEFSRVDMVYVGLTPTWSGICYSSEEGRMRRR